MRYYRSGLATSKTSRYPDCVMTSSQHDTNPTPTHTNPTRAPSNVSTNSYRSFSLFQSGWHLIPSRDVVSNRKAQLVSIRRKGHTLTPRSSCPTRHDRSDRDNNCSLLTTPPLAIFNISSSHTMVIPGCRESSDGGSHRGEDGLQ